MKYVGNILKMESSVKDEVVYKLPIADKKVEMNLLLNSEIELQYNNEINCIKCGVKIKKSYAQGYCYPCFISLPETDECILRPEKCLAHEGVSRDMKWSEQHCLQDHYVYLAISSGLKVGVTRSTQVPTRWIDQGAIEAILLAKTPNRYLAGMIEVFFKKYFADKTNWRNMLTNKIDTTINLLNAKKKAAGLISEKFEQYICEDNAITKIKYPVINYPNKVKSHSFDKEDVIKGVLKGIKGQYLIFEDNTVLNIRKHTGYNINLII